MGLIRWEETRPGPYEDKGVMWHGYLGDDCICFVADFGPSVEMDGVLHLGTHREFPGLAYDERRTPCGTVERGKHLAEMLLLDWMSDVGMVSKAEFDEARRSAAWYISALRDAEAASKRRYDEICDLQAENTVLKERIGSAFGDIDDAITALKRKVDDIVDDTGVARTWSWDVPVDEWWNGGKGPKQRTEADFLNADIDANGYVTFRDGGAA